MTTSVYIYARLMFLLITGMNLVVVRLLVSYAPIAAASSGRRRWSDGRLTKRDTDGQAMMDCRKFKTYSCRMVASGYDDFCSYGERKDGGDAEG